MTKYGSWMMLGNPQIAEIMSQSKVFDFLVIDMQHSTITDREMENMLARIDCDKYVRINKGNSELICKALDAGADHIIIPNVYSPQDIAHFRSYGLYRSRGYGFDEEEGEHKIIAQIEYPLKKDEVIDILNVSDGYIIGPYDMRQCGGTDKNEKEYLAIAKRMNKIRGYHIVFPTKEKIKEKIKEGYNFLIIGIDTIAIGEWCRQWKKYI